MNGSFLRSLLFFLAYFRRLDTQDQFFSLPTPESIFEALGAAESILKPIGLRESLKFTRISLNGEGGEECGGLYHI